MVIIIISSVLKSVSDNLENKGISQITHYITYILMVTIIMKNFSEIIVMVKTSIENLVGFSNSLIPILITLMISTRQHSFGNYASTYNIIYNNIYRKLCKHNIDTCNTNISCIKHNF